MPRAPRQCPGKGGQCTNLIVGRRYCEDCTIPWAGPRTASSEATSSRKWKDELRPSILDRDRYACQIRYQGICTGYATVVDKRTPAARRPDLAHDEANLQAACVECNDHKALTADRGLPAPPRLPD
ncbi:HNH endonuclease [Mycobacterium paragordonae]|uniref:HNH endonuclease n=1 Tax=Mycobacterium paragordonae TaxID=1389713 RepID=UPI00105E233C|nr:HNH endonuclease [Mycobacterium paragordonae]TDL05441.1 HNH endonuclease [Mycobacterium paragordonae]